MYIFQDEIEKIEENQIFHNSPLFFLTTKNGSIYISWDTEEKKRWWGGWFSSIQEAKNDFLNQRINLNNYRRVVNRCTN